jgi:hypothetical protein
MTRRELIDTFHAGSRWAVTNHYITREDHPCYGTREAVVVSVSTAGVTLEPGGYSSWPKASELRVDGDGIHWDSHPHASGPFLTFQAVRTD